MSITSNFPTSKPALNLNFAGSKRLDPRVTFSRSSSGTYVDDDGLIKIAGTNRPRFDHDPVTGVCNGLLVEESRTNETTNSLAIFGTGNGGLVTLPTGVFAPDGTNQAVLINPGVTQLWWAQGSGANSLGGYVGDVSFTYYAYSINSSVNLFPNQQDSGTSIVRATIPGKWTRIRSTITLNNNTTAQWRITTYNSTVYTQAQYDAGERVYVWGIQVEKGSFPTSYIPTSGSAVTRAADTILLSGNNFSSFYNTSGGTIAATVKPTSNTQDRTNVLTIGDGTNTNYAAVLSALPGAGGGQFRSTSSTIPQTDLTSVGSGQSVLNISATFTNNSFNINTNSNGVSSGTTGTLATPNQLQIGVLGTSTNRFNGTISKINYYPSVVSNTNLVALSSANTIPSLRSNQFAFTVRIPSGNYTYTLLTNNSGTYNYNVDWGDGTVTNGVTTNNPTRTYVNAGVYRIVVTQNSGSFYFYNNANTTLGPLVTSGVSVGTGFSWSSSLNAAWQLCSSLTSFSTINTSNVTNFQNSWSACSSLTSFPLIDTSSGTNFLFSWNGCSSLTSFPIINTGNGSNFQSAWGGCSSLTSFPLLNTGNGTNFQQTWNNCSSLTSFPLINTSNGTNFFQTWNSCSSLTSFSAINLSKGTNFTNSWSYCSSLTSFPAITFGGTGATNPIFPNTWNGCTKLTTFPTGAFNACTGSTNYTSAWNACGLGTTSIENILTSIVSSGATINTPTPGNIGLNGGTNASFSTWTSPAITAYNTLVGAGWTISYNP